MSDAVVELQGLTLRFGRRVILDRLEGTLAGRAVGLLGPNGAGKTTLRHTLLGFHKPTAGTARVLGHDVVAETDAVRARLGYMPENESFVPGMSAVRLVRMMAELAGLTPAAALERAHEALWFVGLGEARYRRVETYSLGMKQLAKLAQAIVHGPRLLLLDEPTNGLDPPARQRMLGLIREIRDSGQVRLIVSSHLLRDVEECCDEVLILRGGRVADSCNLAEERRTNRRFVELELHAPEPAASEAFVAAARKLGCEAAPGGRRGLKLVLPPELGMRDLFQIASDHGVVIRRLNFKRDSLEDIFLKAMEKGDAGS